MIGSNLIYQGVNASEAINVFIVNNIGIEGVKEKHLQGASGKSSRKGVRKKIQVHQKYYCNVFVFVDTTYGPCYT
ncbi:MAG: hypothetical protein AB7D92_11160 [Sphaerochaeta sp.]